jgi:hypothetical protein
VSFPSAGTMPGSEVLLHAKSNPDINSMRTPKKDLEMFMVSHFLDFF